MASTVPFHHQHSIVGREREQDQLRDALSRALKGQGQLVLISGEAGIGKTTLVRDLIRRAEEQGSLVLSGGCYDLTSTPPYGPWSELLESYEPDRDLPDKEPIVLPSDDRDGAIQSPAALFASVRQFLSAIAGSRPLVVVLEDLHWSDPASVELLRYLSRNLGESAVLLTATYRDDGITRRHTMHNLLPLLVRESRCQRIYLNRLDREAVQELVTHRYDLAAADGERLVEYVATRSQGNPFFAGELLQGLKDEQALRATDHGWVLGQLNQVHVPPLLRQVLDARLDRLSAQTRSALQTAAVIGQEVALDPWQMVTKLDAEQFDRVLAEAIELRLLEDSQNTAVLVFRHALLRESLYESIVFNQRRAIHRQVGEAFVEMANPDPDAVAHHFEQAGDPRAIAWHIRAGLRALRTAWFSAAQHFESAAALLDGDQTRERERGWLLLAAGSLLRWSGKLSSVEHVEEAERLGRSTGDRELAAYACGVHGAQLCIRGDIRRGIQEMQRSVDAVDALPEAERLPPVDMEGLADLQWMFAGVEESVRNRLLETDVPRVALQRGPLTNWLSQSGRYREAVAVGEAYLADLQLAFVSDSRPRAVVHSGYIGAGDAYAALGRPEAAREAYELGRAKQPCVRRFCNGGVLCVVQHADGSYPVSDGPTRGAVSARSECCSVLGAMPWHHDYDRWRWPAN